MMKENTNVLEKILAIILIVLTISMFATWGYKVVNFLLSAAFNVTTQTTYYDLFIGILGIIGSVLIFIGACLVFKLKRALSIFFMFGASVFFIKVLLDIINQVYLLSISSEITSWAIKTTSWTIGWYLLVLAFWIFVLIFFNRRSFSEQLTN